MHGFGAAELKAKRKAPAMCGHITEKRYVNLEMAFLMVTEKWRMILFSG